ncbi:MAG: hypothetical protein CXR30_00910 [Geobacter sp.]|nr:MAG: hypothetical protein CXR30_00910 [Geobacter sp.]
MNILKVKKSITLLVGMIAITALGGIAQAETRFAVQDSTGTTDKMVVTDTGAVGVGTNAPISSIHVVGATNASAQLITHTNYTGSAGGGSFIGLHNNANGALPAANDRLGYFYFGSKSGNNYRLGGGMSVYADGPWTDMSLPTAFKFETAPATTSTTVVSQRTERMRITSSGNIGIGTDVPKQALEVNGGIRINNIGVSFRPVTPKPACNNTTGPTTDSGVLWFTKAGDGYKDTLEICAKDASNNYAWRTIY